LQIRLRFYLFLQENKVNFKHCQFSDHHHFTDTEIEKIKREFACLSSSKKIILTTEKDYVRLKNSIKELSYLGIQTSFLSRQEEFNLILKSHVKQNKGFT